MTFTWLHVMGYLGFLGFLGFIDPMFFGFFGLFAFLGAFKNVRHDELFEINVNKACRNVFISTFITSIITLICIAFFDLNTVVLFGFLAIFLLQIIVFFASLMYYERMT